MTKKTSVQADGGDHTAKRQRPSLGPKKQRSTESSGGPYANPNTDNESGNEEIGTFGKHGGQSEIEYSGPDNVNATTKDA